MASDTDEDDVMEFEIPVSSGPSSNLFLPHDDIYAYLYLDEDDVVLSRIFFMVAALCDPMTQPGENGVFQLSVRAISDVAIALAYQIMMEEKNSESAAAELLGDVIWPQSQVEVEESNTNTSQTRSEQSEAQEHAETAETAENNLAQESSSQALPRDAVALLHRFELSVYFFRLLDAANATLHTDNEVELRHLCVDALEWRSSAQLWLPMLDTDTYDHQLKVLYYVCSVVAQALFLMFENEQNDEVASWSEIQGNKSNLAKNPYTDYLMRMWKCHTRVVQLALDMDRQLEEDAWKSGALKPDSDQTVEDLPDLVKRALIGSSALRCVLAAGLEHDCDLWKENDLCALLMLDFFDPGSRIQPGSLFAEVEPIAAATLVLRANTDFLPAQYDPLFAERHNYRPSKGPEDAYWEALHKCFPSSALCDHSVMLRRTPEGMSTDLLADVTLNDNLDYDVRYIFEGVGEESGSEHSDEFPMAVRRDVDDIEFDDQGRDWRDCVRAPNTELDPKFAQLLLEFDPDVPSDHFFSTFPQAEEGLRVFALLEIEYMPRFLEHVGQALVNTVALAATKALDGDALLVDSLHRFLASPAPPSLLKEALTHKPLLLQRRKVTTFELVLVFNPATAAAVMDELLMVNGLRRSMIWFLCHSVNLLMSLMNYVYELASGLRGASLDQLSLYTFLRKGKLVLSPVEQLMLLHEFFLNTGNWLIAEASDSDSGLPERALKMVACLCMMIERLASDGTILFTPTEDEFDDYSHDVRTLLFPWIGRLVAARILYFDVQSAKFDNVKKKSKEEEEEDEERRKWKEEEAKLMEQILGPDTFSLQLSIYDMEYERQMERRKEFLAEHKDCDCGSENGSQGGFEAALKTRSVMTQNRSLRNRGMEGHFSTPTTKNGHSDKMYTPDVPNPIRENTGSHKDDLKLLVYSWVFDMVGERMADLLEKSDMDRPAMDKFFSRPHVCADFMLHNSITVDENGKPLEYSTQNSLSSEITDPTDWSPFESRDDYITWNIRDSIFDMEDASYTEIEKEEMEFRVNTFVQNFAAKEEPENRRLYKLPPDDICLDKEEFPLASEKYRLHYINRQDAAKRLKERIMERMKAKLNNRGYYLVQDFEMLQELRLECLTFDLNTVLAVAVTRAYGRPLQEGTGTPYFQFNDFIRNFLSEVLLSEFIQAVEWQLIEPLEKEIELQLSSGGVIEEVEKNDQNEETLDAVDAESEFNDEFLNGKVQYLESKKKKKKKAKKRKK